MKKTNTMKLVPRRLVAVLSAAGLACLAHAQEASAPANRGKMLDRSQSRLDAAPASAEREAAGFAGLAPSGLSTSQRRMILEAVAPAAPARRSVTIDDRLSGTNFESGRDVLLPAALARLDALAAQLKGKQKLRIEVVGHTDNQRIAARLKPVFPDNQALSEARALAVVRYLMGALQLDAGAFAASGKGETMPVAGNDTLGGMAQNRRTEIRAWFEEAVLEADPATAPARRRVEQLVVDDACQARVPGGAPFSISVDGVPLVADTSEQEADRQRCADVALERAGIQVKYDPLNVAPALNGWLAMPAAVRGAPVRLGTYTNYAPWIKRAEIRIFLTGRATQEAPYAIVPVDIGKVADWTPPADAPEDLGFLVRVYDARGRFDETRLIPLRLLERMPPAPRAGARDALLAGWGESSLRLRNIGASGGTVTVSGERIAAGSAVTALGLPVPVDAQGRFAVRQIVPAGPQGVEVAVRDPEGRELRFSRNLVVADQDWFYVAVADLTVGRDRSTGPAQLVTGDLTHYKNETWVDGRGAFYLKGKIKGEYLLTASADTREQPLRDLFHNFQNKDPNYLLRRIDPDKYYPVYGDDSTTVDDAPTQGRMYVRLDKGDSSVMWGNFQTAWTGSELAQYSRGLYGANAVWNSEAATRYGEKQASVNVFAASPGTLQSREEFRGTGGSQFYLRHLDLTQGSERLWIEVRDKDSGLAIERVPLSPSEDYEINYLQGRVTLRSPLSSVSDGRTLVQTSTLAGNPQYLVATYEYAPGLQSVSGSTVGARGNWWVNQHLRLGASHYRQGEDDSDQTLKELDAILRYTPGTWAKAELARSEGQGTTGFTSLSGGYDFTQQAAGGAPANARRLDAALDLKDLGFARGGRWAAYWQHREAGFSGPGQALGNGEAMRQAGASGTIALGERTELALKGDQREATTQDASAAELALRHKIDAQWGVSAALRHDARDNHGPRGEGAPVGASPLLAQEGGRTDTLVRIDYRPLAAGAQAPAASAAPAAGTADPAAATPAVGQSMLEGGVTAPLANAGREARLNGQPALALDPTAAAGVAAARVEGALYAPWNAYGFVQRTLARSGQRLENDRVGLGASRQFGERLRLGAEASGGDGGPGGQLFGNVQLDERSSVYLNYRSETEVADASYAGRMTTLTGGGRYRLSEQAALFAESRWGTGAGPQSLTHAFGVDLAPGPRWTTGLKFETGTLSDPQTGDIERDAVGLTAAYADGPLKLASALEYRVDRTTALGDPAGGCAGADVRCGAVPGSERRQVWLTRNSLSYQYSPAWRLLGKLNLSRSSASRGAFYDGDYTEVVAGGAYRPVDNDRWNTLLKYTYFYNLPTAGQVNGGAGAVVGVPGGVSGGTLDYTQKSNVLNVDTIYDATPWLSLGAKVGLRVGKLRASRTEGDWYSSRADLAVLRADFHWVHMWDAIVEARRLKAREAGDARGGFLVGAYYHVARHAKIGVGYNFTNFSDDLTDLSYRSRGWFLNAISTF